MEILFKYTALQVRDLTKSMKFYSTILGMKAGVRIKVKETNGEMCVLHSGSGTLELNQYSAMPYKKGKSLDHLAFEVDELDEFRKMLKVRGIRAHDYLETRNWRRLFITDPDANWIEVYQRK